MKHGKTFQKSGQQQQQQYIPVQRGGVGAQGERVQICTVHILLNY